MTFNPFTGTFEIGKSPSAQIVPFTGNLTVDASHNGKLLVCTDANPATVTLPASTSTPLPVGFQVSILQWNSGAVDVVAEVGATLNLPSGATATLYGQNAVAAFVQVETDSWVGLGNLTPA